MATKKKVIEESPIVVVDGDYFSATYGKKKIRGIVENYGSDDFPELRLLNSTTGDEVDCANDYDFSHYIELGRNEKGTIEDLGNAKVKNYVVLKDKRQRAIVDKDKLPTLETENGDWRVVVDGDRFIFGCGNVTLSRKQIEGYLRMRESVPANLENIRETEVEDCSIEELEAYIAYEKAKTGKKGDGALYEQVIRACEDELSENRINEIPEADIKALFKYMDWINGK
jgi:hypothetical protein